MKDYINLNQYMAILARYDKNKVVKNGLINPHSWRGRYAELSFEPSGYNVTIGTMYEYAYSARDKTFEGWKGGDFYMQGDTLIHRDYEGSCHCDGLTEQDIIDMIEAEL